MTMRKPLRRVSGGLRKSSEVILKHPRLVVKKIHHHVAEKPHQRLMNRYQWYKNWHEKKYHSHVHFSILVPYLFVIVAIVLFSYNKSTFAADVTNTWDFTYATNFVFDDTVVETNGTSVRLKAPFSIERPTVSLFNSANKSGVMGYTSFTTDETDNGGLITYRLSDDGGVTWKFWNGFSWATANSLDDANDEGSIDMNIATFPVTFDGINWQAILTSDGTQAVTLNSVTIVATSDVIEPTVVPDSIAAKKVNAGPTIDFNAWTNGSSPYFSWEPSEDADSGILGYCVYLGHDFTADLSTTSGLFGTSPINGSDYCRYVTSNTYIDLATPGVLAAPLTSSTDPYYFLVRSIDKAGNVSAPTTFAFGFDNIPPTNPDYISGPTTFINSKNATFTWEQTAADAHSNILGLQYKINNTGWQGDIHNGAGDITDVLEEDGTYTTSPEFDYDNIHEGINMIYFRTWDVAGNVSTTTVGAVLKVNTNGSPSGPQSLTANPTSGPTNSFAFNWNAPATFVGSPSNLTYCYTINTLPTVDTCSYTAPGVTYLTAGPYATQPGSNTLYVVARDESNSINYDNYTSVIFTANTSAPGIIRNIDISDLSVRSTSNWRLAVTWDAPVDTGAGINTYKVYRSLNGTSFTQTGTSANTTYIDTGLIQQLYYYRITACDSTNNCSADSEIVSMSPTGRFKVPANMIGNPTTTNITTKRARIQWTTDRDSDSKVLIGTSSGTYNTSEVGSSSQVSVHQIDLDNLVAGTTYYYKAKWTDVDNNMAQSQEFSFTTKPAPVVKEVNASKINISGATISFTSINTSKVELNYGESDAFGSKKSINTSPDESTYSIELASLKDGTKYYYRVSAYDSESGKYDGNIYSFTTPSRPRISNLRFQPVAGQPTSTQSVTWVTNVPTSSTVTYGKVGTEGADVQVSKLVTDHQIVISGLSDNSDYFLIAQSRDVDGNLAVSDRQVFKTALDTRPPLISDVNIESSIVGNGAEARGQVIISWKTDELSTSQIGYAEGSTAKTFSNKTSEDVKLTTEHIVVLSDLPTSKVYSIQAMSYDKARNLGTSETQPAIVSRPSESVLTIILSALQRVFGF